MIDEDAKVVLQPLVDAVNAVNPLLYSYLKEQATQQFPDRQDMAVLVAAICCASICQDLCEVNPNVHELVEQYFAAVDREPARAEGAVQ